METISIYEATQKDLELLMAWRSNPLVYQGFYLQNKPLTWEEHFTWWNARHDRMDWIIVLNNGECERKVGSVNTSSLSATIPEIGVVVGEVTAWNRGIGRRAVALVLDWLEKKGYKRAKAGILKDNLGSIGLFKSLGFKFVEEGRPGELMYQINISDKV